MAGLGNRLDDVLDVIDRVGNTGVFGFRAVVEINRTVGQHRDVFQQRIAFDGVIDIRLGFFGQLDGFGVATAFEVEHAVVIPAVFVIANQLAFWIGGQGGFAGAGQAEEHRHVTFFTHVSRAVHGSDAFQRQQVVHHGEHTLFHFAAVPGAANQLHAFGQVESDKVFRVQALLLPVRVSAFGAVHHYEVRFEILQFFFRRANEHVFDEVRLPGNLGDKADFQA